jgi:GNAT superfamily N-acetyltransferase
VEHAPEAGRRDIVSLLIANYALFHVALGAWQLIGPGSFFDAIGPFGESNPHYTRDVGTFTLALGVAFAIAYVRPAWRLGVVGYALFQYAFHAVNHLFDIGDADPEVMGPVDFALIALTALVLGWMLRELLRRGRGAVEP